MKKFFVATSIIALSLSGAVAQAAGLVNCGSAGEPACRICDIFNLINNLIKYVLVIFVPLGATLIVAISGIKMLINRDNAEVWEQSKQIILTTIVGLVLIYGAYAVVNTLFASMGVTSFNPLEFNNIDCTP